jgi:hypothetical protein
MAVQLLHTMRSSFDLSIQTYQTEPAEGDTLAALNSKEELERESRLG